MIRQLIAPTKRKKMTKKEAARLFLLHNGICCNCDKPITSGQSWFIEHVEALVLGGQETDENRRPAHTDCKAKKDAEDARKRSKRDRIITKHWQRPDARKSALAGPDVKYSRARGCWIDRRTGEIIEDQA